MNTMKRLVLVGLLVLAFSTMSAQKTRGEKQKQVNELYKNRAVVERFDGAVIKTEDQKQQERAANEKKRMQILNYLDTLSISSGAKKKLRIDLDENPFSARFQKFMLRYKKEVDIKQNKTSIAQQK